MANIESLINAVNKRLIVPITDEEIRNTFLNNPIGMFALCHQKPSYIKKELKRFGLKECSKCYIIKDIGAFKLQKKSTNCLYSSCVDCVKLKNKQLYQVRKFVAKKEKENI